MSTIRIKNGISYDLNGWKYISVKGNASERGYAYGYFVAKEFKEIQKMLNYIVYEDLGEKWPFFIDAGVKLLKDTIKDQFKEYYDEMEGIAKGITAGGTPTTTDEIIAWNNYFTLTEYWFPTRDGNTGVRKGEGGAPDRCSAFMATGKDYTEDGGIVVNHNNFSNFIDGQYANVVVDMQCDNGCRMLYQAFAGWIWSGTDFFVTGNGIIGTETTIGGFVPFENNIPVSCRIRKAMQYGKNLDDYSKILLDGNGGDYANSWLFGDVNTNEIMRIELGLKYHNIEKTKNGYFIGFNAAYDPRIRNLECVDTGYDDIRRHQGSRRVRLEDLIQEHKGKINIEIAKKIISDHYDVYLNKIELNSRTVCSHYDLDAREYMSDPSRPKPYAPRGAIDGCVVDSKMAKKMSFELRYGNSCGTPFLKNEFCDRNRQWAHLREYLHDRPQQPWTVFSITNDHKKSGTYKKRRKGKSSRQKTNKNERE